MSLVQFFCYTCKRNTWHVVSKAGYVCPVCTTRNG
jgi:DNA-directed RNA polymerase subunit RPC12/RpoP